ncbi:MAG: hypothetical protein R3E89_00830 [Thiolinea sp.]
MYDLQTHAHSEKNIKRNVQDSQSADADFDEPTDNDDLLGIIDENDPTAVYLWRPAVVSVMRPSCTCVK